MYLTVNGAQTYAYTGDHAFDPAKPTVVFIHGVLNDHSVWILQSRHLAYNGWNVLAIDLPGHGRSAGKPPKTVEEGADFIRALLQAAGAEKAALVGHSFGSLIAMEAAARNPDRVTHLALLGTAAPMRVAPALLEASVKEPEKAIHMVNVFSHSTLCPPPSALGPGTWLYGASRALMRRVLASNRDVNLFYTGFKACDSYAGAEKAVAAVRCPTLFVLGRGDRMTPPKSARALAQHAARAEVVEVNGGHAMMLEAPDEVLLALKRFLGR
jgi:pimeloyl-ACP methyl ester carboxylesterase